MSTVPTETSSASKPPVKPWWRDPLAIGFTLAILFACAAILSVQPKPVDPTKPAPLPGGGNFCDTPAPTKSTLERPPPLKPNP
jgi:hypothetical protein